MNIFIQENAFENVICKMSALMFRPLSVMLWLPWWLTYYLSQHENEAQYTGKDKFSSRTLAEVRVVHDILVTVGGWREEGNWLINLTLYMLNCVQWLIHKEVNTSLLNHLWISMVVMLNLCMAQGKWKYICYDFWSLRQRLSRWNLSSWQRRQHLFYDNQYHGCWCPDGARNQIINIYDIDLA